MSPISISMILKRPEVVQDKARIGEQAECTLVHEHCEPILNAVLRRLRPFQQPARRLRPS